MKAEPHFISLHFMRSLLIIHHRKLLCVIIAARSNKELRVNLALILSMLP